MNLCSRLSNILVFTKNNFYICFNNLTKGNDNDR